jgi:hypothetical protein
MLDRSNAYLERCHEDYIFCCLIDRFPDLLVVVMYVSMAVRSESLCLAERERDICIVVFRYASIGDARNWDNIVTCERFEVKSGVRRSTRAYLDPSNSYATSMERCHHCSLDERY